MNIELINAWRAWDAWALTIRTHRGRLKGHEGRRETDRMEDACAKAAAELGITATELRERLMGARRQGLCHEDAVTEVCG